MNDRSDMVTVAVRIRGRREEVGRAMEDFQRTDGLELLPWRPDGGWPVALARLVGEDVVARFAKRGVRSRRLDGIDGGDMTAHVHLGDDIYLLETEVFQELVGEVARRLTTEFAGKFDYEKTVDLMSTLAIDTVPLPEHRP
jgi:hypothetical protein